MEVPQLMARLEHHAHMDAEMVAEGLEAQLQEVMWAVSEEQAVRRVAVEDAAAEASLAQVEQVG